MCLKGEIMKKNYLSKQLLENFSSKKAFIFDFDGTLASTEELLFLSLQKVAKNHGFNYTKNDYEKIKGKPSKEYFGQFKEFLKEDIDVKEVLDEFLLCFDEVLKVYKLNCYDYVKELIKTFPDKIYCVASNNVTKFLNDRIKEFGYEKYFKYIFACGGSDGMSKDYFYKNTKSLIGTNAEDCVLFEDNQDYIKMAAEQKITTVGIVHKENIGIKADFLIDLSDEE